MIKEWLRRRRAQKVFDVQSMAIAVISGSEVVQQIVTVLFKLHQKVDVLMKTEKQLVDDLTAIGGDLAAIQAGVSAIRTQNQQLQAQVADLKATVAALQASAPVTQEQLDAIVAQADGIEATASATASTVNALPSPTPAADVTVDDGVFPTGGDTVKAEPMTPGVGQVSEEPVS